MICSLLNSYADKDIYTLSAPRKLVYEEKYKKALWQKNWLPFEYNQMMLFIYSITPHEIIYPNLGNGSCYKYDFTNIECPWDWALLEAAPLPS